MIDKDDLKKALENRDSSFFLSNNSVDILNLWLPEGFVQDYNEHIYHVAIRLSMTPLVRQIIGSPRVGPHVLFAIKTGSGLTPLQVAARFADKPTFTYVYGTYSNRDMSVDFADLANNVPYSDQPETIDYICERGTVLDRLSTKKMKAKDVSIEFLKYVVEKDHVRILECLVTSQSDLRLEIEPNLTLLDLIQKKSRASYVQQYLTALGMRSAKKRTNIVI